jgi:hypothetical protein
MAQEASYFAQETVAAGHMQLGQKERLKQQDALGTKAVDGEELANQQEELEQQNYTCSQNQQRYNEKLIPIFSIYLQLNTATEDESVVYCMGTPKCQTGARFTLVLKTKHTVSQKFHFHS